VDQGPGIQKSNLSQIFSPLFTTKQEGTGLGLYSCKSIVNQHGGTIHFSNDPSTFTIKLPKTVNTPNGEKNE
jgi:signal transduction histidine kinase